MLLRRTVRAFLVLCLVPASAMALGLGDIHLKSALNAPLDAEIDLTATADELAEFRSGLANRDTFARYGLDFPAFLGNTTVVAAKSAEGRDVLRVRSSEVVTEPFITLLIDVNWARGRAIREYTVLVDPPIFTAAPAAAAVAEPATSTSQRGGNVDRAAATPRPAAAPAAVPAAASGAQGYQVRAGDTLSRIAAQNYPGVGRERALVAIYRANPAAFDGNMNELRAGAQLQLPDAAAVGAVGPAEASAEVGRQFQTWNQARRGAGQLRLVPPQDSSAAATPSLSAGSGTGSTGGGNAALQQRVTELERQLTESQRLLELRNAELARLQGRAGTPPAAAPAGPATPPAASTTPEPAPAVAESPPAEAESTATEAPTPTASPPAPAAAAEGTSILDWLLQNWYLPAGVIVLLVGLLGVRAWRSRQAQDFDQSLDRLSGAAFDRAASSTATLPVRSLPEVNDSILVEESGPHEQPRFDSTDEGFGIKPAKSVAVDDTVSGDTAVALEQGDPLAEADFHMAYGLYDQAADLVRLAISREPQRRDLRLKLLEVFFVWGNKDQFLPLARELSENRAQALPGEWEKIIIMGRQIAPEDSLFSSGAPLGAAAISGVDLNLEGGQNRIDFDLLGEPTVSGTGGHEGVDLDLGAALGDKPAIESTGRIASDAGVDFVLDDPARGADATGSTREMPVANKGQHTITMELSGLDAEAPTVEQPRLEDTDKPTIRQKLDALGRQSLAGGEATAELALDDLGLDLGTAEVPVAAPLASDSTAQEPTVLANIDDATRKLAAQAATVDTALTGSVPSLAPTASGTWLFTDSEASAVMPQNLHDQATQLLPAPTEIMPALGSRTEDEGDLTGLTGRLEALKSAPGDMDLDLGGSEATGTNPALNGLDLDVGHAAPAAETPFAETQRLAAGDTELPDLEPPTMSEVGTKLDLARAYMDMGDPEGARSILDEVLNEGSASQKQEARRLIESLPG